MKSKPIQSVASLALAIDACGGSAAAAPGDHLPKPEDPVVLPSDEETAAYIKNVRESNLRLLKYDKDGWDDLEVMIWKSIDKNYKFEPDNKTKDTDGDGMSDYEEMLVNRSPIFKEPNYTREERIAQIREERRRAIQREIAIMEEATRLWPVRQAKLAETLQPAFEAGKTVDDPNFLRHDSTAVRARLLDRRNKAMADRVKTEAELDAIATKYGVKRADERGTLVGESEQGPIFMSPQDAIGANSIFADDLWPVGLYPWQNTSLTRNLTGAGIRASIWEANASDGTAGILTTHGEFNSARAVQVDGGAASNHGTAVANVMVGGGIYDVFRGATNYGKLLRGIAYEGEVRGHNLNDFVFETTNVVLDGQRFSNHSYGVNGGWKSINVSGTTWWLWEASAFTEDPRLGLYSPSAASGNSSADLDSFVVTAETHLPVYASGNPNGGGPGNPVAPATTVSHLIPNGGGYAVSTVVRDWINGDDSYDTVLSPGTAKNVLTVGSITDINGASFGFSGFTGTGPTDDGRIKPEVVAVGQRNSALGYGGSLFAATKAGASAYYNGITADSEGTVNLAGTSFAAPSVAGGLMLAEQRRKQLLPSAGPLLASTWRAAGIHTALDYGTPGPDYIGGYGIFNAEKLVASLEADAALGRGTLIKEFTVQTGTPKTFYVTLPANTAGELTLAWSDPAGSPPAFATVLDGQTAMLVNNLDLVAQDTVTLANHLPWVLDPNWTLERAAVRGAAATRGVDSRNNAEKVTIDAVAQSRRLKVAVNPVGTLQSGSQKVSLILSGAVPETPVVTSSGFTMNPANLNEYQLTFSSDPGAFYTLETSTTLTGTWTSVSRVKAENSTSTVLTSRNPAEPRRFWRMRRGQ
jgi:hypothetical protein